MTSWEDLINGALEPAPQSSGGGDMGGYVRQGLIERGLPEHVADGFVMNMQDESGLDPGINERNPTVAGSRGGFGLYQLTGPRRRAYEAFAAQRGTDAADPDAQMDFLMWELGNTESRAAQRIMSASNAGEAGAAIVTDFLRPAAEHRERRVAKYLGGDSYTPPSARTESAMDYSKLWLALGE